MKQVLLGGLILLWSSAPASPRQSGEAGIASVNAAVVTMQSDAAVLHDHTVIVGNGLMIAGRWLGLTNARPCCSSCARRNPTTSAVISS